MISTDNFMDRRSTASYNCLDFVREVWKELTGEDVTDRLTGLVGAFTQRRVTRGGVKGFMRLKSPANPCFVVFQRKGTIPHVGIFLDSRVLHLHARGVEFQPLDVAREYFTSIRYYR